MDTQIDILNRVEKASKGSMAIVWTKPLASRGKKLRNGPQQELADGGGGHVEHDHGHGEAGDDAHEAHAQLAEVVE